MEERELKSQHKGRMWKKVKHTHKHTQPECGDHYFGRTMGKMQKIKGVGGIFNAHNDNWLLAALVNLRVIQYTEKVLMMIKNQIKINMNLCIHFFSVYEHTKYI